MKHCLTLLFILLLLLAGCSKGGQGRQKLTPLAEVNGDILYLEEFRSTFSDEQWNDLSEPQKKQEIENWVNLTLLAQAAKEQELDKQMAVRQRLDFAQKKVQANALLAKRLSRISIGEEEMFNYYRVHSSEFQSKLMEYDVQRILCKDAATADILLKRIRGGYDFNTAVLEQSADSLKKNLGRIGYVTASGADSLFWRAAHELKQNEPGLASINGAAYVLRYTQQREGTQDANFSEYRSEIRSILLRERQRQVYEDILRELKAGDNDIYYY